MRLSCITAGCGCFGFDLLSLSMVSGLLGVYGIYVKLSLYVVGKISQKLPVEEIQEYITDNTEIQTYISIVCSKVVLKKMNNPSEVRKRACIPQSVSARVLEDSRRSAEASVYSVCCQCGPTCAALWLYSTSASHLPSSPCSAVQFCPLGCTQTMMFVSSWSLIRGRAGQVEEFEMLCFQVWGCGECGGRLQASKYNLSLTHLVVLWLDSRWQSSDSISAFANIHCRRLIHQR